MILSLLMLWLASLSVNDLIHYWFGTVLATLALLVVTTEAIGFYSRK